MTTTAQTTDSTSTEAPAKMLPISTVAPLNIPDTDMIVSWTRRSTTANPVANENRYRGVIVNRSTLALPDGSTTSKFTALLQSTIHALADKKFQALMQEDGGMQLKEIPASSLTLDSVLTYWAAERQNNQIDNAKLTAWLTASKTLEALPEATRKVWLTKLPKIAAPGYQNLFTKEQAATIISRLNAEELEAPEAEFIVTRCNAIIVKPELSEAF